PEVVACQGERRPGAAAAQAAARPERSAGPECQGEVSPAAAVEAPREHPADRASPGATLPAPAADPAAVPDRGLAGLQASSEPSGRTARSGQRVLAALPAGR